MSQYENKLLRMGLVLVLAGLFLPFAQFIFPGLAHWLWFVAGQITVVLGLIFFAATDLVEIVVDESESYPSKPQRKKDFSRPVAWLLGRQLVSGLKWIALYSAYQDKLDLKDWMQANVEDFAASDFNGKEFWFDYLSDTGDGQLPTYSMAYLCMSDLWTTEPPGAAADGFQNAGLDKTDQWSKKLPRGAFLFIGGDTAYHIADYATLAERFQSPFRWANDDLKEAGKEPDQRPLFGIPGNHDCYDLRDGFHRQFRRPMTPENIPNRWGQIPQLSVPGFVRRQEASYVALHLPFGWWFWGIDAQGGKLDIRQTEFFCRCNGGQVPGKLIVATPEPTTVFGARADPASYLTRAFVERLKLEAPFLRDGTLERGKCRLDLSGDIHHYARYWGPASDSSPSGTPAAPNYASVVSGSVGAFLHPTQTSLHQVKHHALYPSVDDSRKAVGKRLLNPARIWTGGGVWFIGAVVAAVMYLGATIGESSRLVFRAISDWLGIDNLGSAGVFGESVLRFRADPPAGSFWNVSFVLAVAVFALLLLREAAHYSEMLFKQSSKRRVTSVDYWPIWAWLFLIVAAFILVLYVAGTYSAREFLFDLLFALVLFGVFFGLTLYGPMVGGNMVRMRGKAGLALLGAWHAVLQLAIPFVLVSCGSLWSIPLAGLLVLLFTFLGRRVVIQASPLPLLSIWILHGAAQLGAPFLLNHLLPAVAVTVAPWWAFTLNLILAAVLGAIMSCVWFGWYLAAALAFNAHNNEAGGAARVERFKQFIRFRLTQDSLTGYVIAVHEPKMNGSMLQPKIVDIFTLTP